ncbi:hypothetical protein [Natronosalvus amylolyticus]|uniref:hypothetical protein n=1 Tax=Natronosalvus amylolyticus TaxID=2961994 RepID=UPI0020C9C570|nr:hypothetical protein [Natronosalvus amylolyticus]
MSDDESAREGVADSADETSGEPTDESEREDIDERKHDRPGGGPKRVVSKTSVDDILSSLNETKPDSKPQGSARVTRSSSDIESSLDEVDASSEVEDTPSNPENEPDDAGDADRTESQAAETTTGDGSSEETDPGTDTVADDSLEDESDDETDSPVDGQRADTEPAPGTDHETDAGDEEAEPTIDADLTERIESGAVTGADVRAAEAGDGREKTPEIDEIDLSLDDLEATTSASASTAETDADATGSTDGPLASTGPKPDDDTDTEETADEETGGIVDKIRGLFGR